MVTAIPHQLSRRASKVSPHRWCMSTFSCFLINTKKKAILLSCTVSFLIILTRITCGQWLLPCMARRDSDLQLHNLIFREGVGCVCGILCGLLESRVLRA